VASNVAATALREEPRYAYWLLGDDAIAWRVESWTWPKPTAKMVIPASLTSCAREMAALAPPPTVWTLSVRRTITFGSSLVLPSRLVMPMESPAAMFVAPKAV
jgi:hypothetical protein